MAIAGIGLVAPGDGHKAIKHVPSGDQLDGIGDDFAADQGCLHPFRTCSNSVIDRNRIDLDRRSAGGAYSLGYHPGELPVIPVARHCADPAMRYADLRAREAFIGKPNRLHHGARDDAISTFE
jgi:hypothetical protein